MWKGVMAKRLIPGLPSLLEMSAVRRNFSNRIEKDWYRLGLPSSFNELTYLPRNISNQIKGELRRVGVPSSIQEFNELQGNFSEKIKVELKKAGLPASLQEWDQITDQIKSELERAGLPTTFQDWQEIPANITDRIQLNLKKAGLPATFKDLKEIPLNITDQIKYEFQRAASTLKELKEIPGNFTNQLKDDIIKMKLQIRENLEKTPADILEELTTNLTLPLDQNLTKIFYDKFMKFTDPLNLTQTSLEKLNEFQNHLQDLKTLLRQKDLINPDTDLEPILTVIKMLPRLIPKVISSHLPDLDGLIVGTEISLYDLYTVHLALTDIEQFLRKTRGEVNVEKAPKIYTLLTMASEKNVALLGHVLALMIRAEMREEKSVILSESDVEEIQKFWISADEVVDVLEGIKKPTIKH